MPALWDSLLLMRALSSSKPKLFRFLIWANVAKAFVKFLLPYVYHQLFWSHLDRHHAGFLSYKISFPLMPVPAPLVQNRCNCTGLFLFFNLLFKFFRNQGETFSPNTLVYNKILSAMMFKFLAKIFQTFPRSFILALNL